MSEARTKWLLRLRSRLYDVMGNNLIISFSILISHKCFVMLQNDVIQCIN